MTTSIQLLVINQSLQDNEDLCRRLGNREIPMPSADKDGYIDEMKSDV
ncbi:hypothetical protein [Synechococcus sp. NOUM97013]|nr:hypothetical protein [Synechococcus sp. NOUM97013]QNI73775.1 hypothetical protein SynNOUM97013_01718 [Synechococcus sp. NOUM97013]